MVCCSQCEKSNSCGKYIHNLSTKYRKEIQTVEALATYGWGSISTDKCEVHYICGPSGNYALYEPVEIDDKEEKKTCKDCKHFIGAGDWNLCCSNPPRSQVSWLGFLCYSDTEACENFEESKEEENNE